MPDPRIVDHLESVLEGPDEREASLRVFIHAENPVGQAEVVKAAVDLLDEDEDLCPVLSAASPIAVEISPSSSPLRVEDERIAPSRIALRHRDHAESHGRLGGRFPIVHALLPTTTPTTTCVDSRA